MEKRKAKKLDIPAFLNELDEANWWASKPGRSFLKQQPPPVNSPRAAAGSKRVAKLAGAKSVQIALRLSSPDLAKAREIAERKGIGYQTVKDARTRGPASGGRLRTRGRPGIC